MLPGRAIIDIRRFYRDFLEEKKEREKKKMDKEKEVESTKLVISKKDKLNTPLEKIIKSGTKTLDKKDCKRLLSEIIKGFVRKEISSEEGKTLVYFLSVYIQHYNFLKDIEWDSDLD